MSLGDWIDPERWKKTEKLTEEIRVNIETAVSKRIEVLQQERNSLLKRIQDYYTRKAEFLSALDHYCKSLDSYLSNSERLEDGKKAAETRDYLRRSYLSFAEPSKFVVLPCRPEVPKTVGPRQAKTQAIERMDRFGKDVAKFLKEIKRSFDFEKNRLNAEYEKREILDRINEVLLDSGRKTAHIARFCPSCGAWLARSDLLYKVWHEDMRVRRLPAFSSLFSALVLKVNPPNLGSLTLVEASRSVAKDCFPRRLSSP